MNSFELILKHGLCAKCYHFESRTNISKETTEGNHRMNRMIATEEELNLLFENKIQRDIFIEIVMRILNEISERTVIIPFIELNEVTE